LFYIYCFRAGHLYTCAARWGMTDVIKVLVEAGPSLSAVDNKVIKPSVKLIQSNIKLFK
jgi:hypothetical protein